MATYSVTKVMMLDEYRDQTKRDLAIARNEEKTLKYGENVQHVWEPCTVFDPESNKTVDVMKVTSTVTLAKD
jgi:hypothetical protein